jgi:hypothetical protein
MRIITNYQPRDVIEEYELTEEEKKEFDYYDWNDPQTTVQFVRYKGELVDLNDMEGPSSIFPEWDSYKSDTFFSGILVKWANNFEQVIMGRYYT